MSTKYKNPPIAEPAEGFCSEMICPEHGPHGSDYCPGCTARRLERNARARARYHAKKNAA